MIDYRSFLEKKAIIDPMTGIDGPGELHPRMFPFQADITRWALRRGRAAIFEGTGLGKTLQELQWGSTVAKHTGKPILHFAPLAVTEQIVEDESPKWGIPARISLRQSDVGIGLNITNYQKLDHFSLSDFGGVILDESSILKNETGHYRNSIISASRCIPFRLAATATPAPNDFMELGNHAEFLGVMSYTDMLATFFVHDGGDTQKWRLKGHAENEFWRWMASWAVMLRKPSDLGYSDDGYDLPPLNYIMHNVDVSGTHHDADGQAMMFVMEAQTMAERIVARRESVSDRVARAIEVTPEDKPFVWWCNLNSESEAITKGIPGAVETKGSDPDDVKVAKLRDFKRGKIRVLVTKPKVAGFGMDWSHCADTGFVGLNDSWEQFYQSVRRFYRFGQTKQVNVHIVASKAEGATVSNIRRKEADAERMATAMVMHMGDLNSTAVRGMVRDRPDYQPEHDIILPDWIYS